MFDGYREGTLLDIDANNMAEFIDEVYQECGVDPSEVEFVEAYGSAIKVSSIQNKRIMILIINSGNGSKRN